MWFLTCKKETLVCLCANLFYYEKRECNLNTNSGPEFCSYSSVHCVCALLAKLWNWYDDFSLSISWPTTPNEKEAESGVLDPALFLYTKWVECFFTLNELYHIFAWRVLFYVNCLSEWSKSILKSILSCRFSSKLHLYFESL